MQTVNIKQTDRYFLQKMLCFFLIVKELQFRADNLGGLCRSQGTSREGELFNGGKQKSGKAIINRKGSLVVQAIKNLPAVPKTWVQSLGQEDPLEKEMATHSSILA